MALTVEQVNWQLAYLFDLIEQNKDLKKEVDFTLQPKRQKRSGGHSATEFELDDESLDLLKPDHPDRTLWLMQPQHFVSFHFSPRPLTFHPVVQTAWQCLLLGDINAQMTIVRRCHYVALDQLQKSFRLSAREIAGVLAPFLPRASMNNLVGRIELVLKRGSRYAVWENDFGEGTVATMGMKMRNEL